MKGCCLLAPKGMCIEIWLPEMSSSPTTGWPRCVCGCGSVCLCGMWWGVVCASVVCGSLFCFAFWRKDELGGALQVPDSAPPLIPVFSSSPPPPPFLLLLLLLFTILHPEAFLCAKYLSIYAELSCSDKLLN